MSDGSVQEVSSPIVAVERTLPFVSILIPCYNAAPWIQQCIQSSLDQTYPHKEIIVFNDGSTDDSLKIIRRFEGRIRIETGQNRGVNLVRNELLEMSSGSWLNFLDADDFIFTSKIESQVDLLQRNPTTDFIYSPCLLYYTDFGLCSDPTASFIDDDLFSNYFRWDYFSTSSLLLKKEALIEVGGWDNSEQACHEHELVLRFILSGKTGILMENALTVYRMQYSNSISRSSPFAMIKGRMELSDRLEAHLLATQQMAEGRRIALAQARLLMARSAYHFDRGFARLLCSKALATGPFVRPRTLHWWYLVCLRALGFDMAEHVAAIRRQLLRGDNR